MQEGRKAGSRKAAGRKEAGKPAGLLDGIKEGPGLFFYR